MVGTIQMMAVCVRTRQRRATSNLRLRNSHSSRSITNAQTKKKRIASTPNPIQKEIVVADSLTPSSKPSEFDTKEAVEISET